MCTIKRNDENKLKHKLPNLASWDNDNKRAVVAATNESPPEKPLIYFLFTS